MTWLRDWPGHSRGPAQRCGEGQETRLGPADSDSGTEATAAAPRPRAALTGTDSSRARPGAPSRSAEVDGRVLRPPGLDDLGLGPLHPFHLVLLLVLLLALAHVHHDAGRGVGGRVQLVLLAWREQRTVTRARARARAQSERRDQCPTGQRGLASAHAEGTDRGTRPGQAWLQWHLPDGRKAPALTAADRRLRSAARGAWEVVTV